MRTRKRKAGNGDRVAGAFCAYSALSSFSFAKSMVLTALLNCKTLTGRVHLILGHTASSATPYQTGMVAPRSGTAAARKAAVLFRSWCTHTCTAPRKDGHQFCKPTIYTDGVCRCETDMVFGGG